MEVNIIIQFHKYYIFHIKLFVNLRSQIVFLLSPVFNTTLNRILIIITIVINFIHKHRVVTI